jgi:two-component system KDP operon response regulator KdpE
MPLTSRNSRSHGSALTSMLARLRAVLRHTQPQGADAIFRSGKLEVDLSARVVRKHGQEIKLTPIEYSLLRLFVTHAGKVLTHRQLLTEVWGPKAVEQTHYLRVRYRTAPDGIMCGASALP